LSSVDWPQEQQWAIGFRDIARGTDARTMIAALVPKAAFGNKLPLILPSSDKTDYGRHAPLLFANLNCIALDFVARQKVHSTSMNWFLVEQFPIFSLDAYTRSFGKKSVAEIVKAEVLALTYTAHDMEPFARDMGYDGAPFSWDDTDRLKRRAKLDALYFILYGITNRDDVAYIYSTFPIVEREEMAAHKRYLSRDYCLMYMNALEAGDPDADIRI
jgi:hypothetical protein